MKNRAFAINIFSLLTVIFSSTAVYADGEKFGLVGKSIDDANFVAAAKACAEAAEKSGDTCKFIGAKGSEHFRTQDSAISEALKGGLDAIAVSITSSEWLGTNSLEQASQAGIPILTFDSALEGQYSALQAGYIGPNNVSFGHDIAQAAIKLRPTGGTICIMSGGTKNPNLNQRIAGIRQALSLNDNYPEDKRLFGENGWTEHSRCPLFNRDDSEMAVTQMVFALENLDVDVFLSVGGWPVVNTELYSKLVAPLKESLLHKKNKKIIIGVGNPSANQLLLIDKGLAHAYVAIDFAEMGRLSYEHMKQLSNGKVIPPITYTKSKLYFQK